MKKFNKWMDSRAKRLDWKDIASIKFAVLFFALMLAKLWPGILGLDWQWYLILGIVFAIRPVYRAYFKR